MQQVKRAALAPAEPSGADRSVAAAAAQKEQQARTELLEERQKEVRESQDEIRSLGESSRGGESVQVNEEVSVEDGHPNASSSEGPSVEAPEAPQAKDHMNLARDARMRIKRGQSWMA